MIPRFVLLTLLSSVLAACMSDLGVDERSFACSTSADCAAGFACEAVSGQPYAGVCRASDVTDGDGVQPPPDYLCRSCTEDGDCGGEGRCTQLPAGKFCTSPCATNDDCPSGYFCFALGVGEPRCVPALVNTCAGCLQEPCPSGEYCDQAANTCRASSPQCDACVHDTECGRGQRCLAFGAFDRRCVPSCVGGCPEGSSCQTLGRTQGTEGVRACVPDGSTCCFGPDCGCSCSADQICDPSGQCVECLTDLQCPLDRPLCEGGQCQSGSCDGFSPHACWQSPSGCCDCLMGNHCPSGACDVGTGQCVEPPTDCYCQAPYPVCVVVNGSSTCVECSGNQDCGGGCSCDPYQYRCVRADGGGFCSATCATACSTDGDCPLGGTYALTCADGCCRDASGACDNVSSFCMVAGSECVSMYDALGAAGDAGTAAWATPGGGDADGDGVVETVLPTGLCSCTRSTACVAGSGFERAAPVGADDKEIPVCCPAGQECYDLLQVVSVLGGMSVDLTPVYDGGAGVCFAPGTPGPLR